VRRKANRHFWNKKREYLKDEINGFAARSKTKNIRDLYREYNNLREATNPEITC
jgi:hypothetical protein